MIKNIILFKSNKVYIENAKYINCETSINIFEEIKNINFDHIKIYDQTYSLKHKQGKIIGVGDHINKTGNNPHVPSFYSSKGARKE